MRALRQKVHGIEQAGDAERMRDQHDRPFGGIDDVGDVARPRIAHGRVPIGLMHALRRRQALLPAGLPMHGTRAAEAGTMMISASFAFMAAHVGEGPSRCNERARLNSVFAVGRLAVNDQRHDLCLTTKPE